MIGHALARLILRARRRFENTAFFVINENDIHVGNLAYNLLDAPC